MFRKLILAPALLAFCFGLRVEALDIYGIVDSSCKVQTGLIIGTEGSTVNLINLKGEFVTVDRLQIDTIVIFNTLQNPIGQIQMDKNLSSLAKDIYVHEDNLPSFTGWPVRFVEDLVIFYDTSGKTHVLDLADVTKIRDLTPESHELFKNTVPEKINLNFSSVNSHCSNLNQGKGEGVGPTRIINDKISVSEFLYNFDKGFQKVDSYEERTYFYAKPYLYEKRSKLGVVVFNTYQENPSILPVYFQWSTGKPYGFQTFNVFGESPSPWLSEAEPIFGYQSEVKSHFFSGTFVGDLPALPAGSPYYTNLAATIKLPKDVFAGHHFNYLTLLGADYGPFTLSVGTYFPIFVFQVKQNGVTEVREALSNAVSPAFRAMYNRGPLTLRFIYSSTQESGSGSDNSNLRLLTAQTGTPDNYNLVASFFRGGADYAFTKELKVGLDEIYTTANYTENWGSNQYFFNSSHLTTSAYLLQSFGYYISVKVFLNIFDDQSSYTFVNGSGSPSAIDTSIGGAFEFDF